MKFHTVLRHILSNEKMLEQLVLIVSFCGTMGWFLYWIDQNPLPDGYQNEYLHVGNAYDLFQALIDLDVWHMRWYMYTGYWPWGLYAVSWPFLLIFNMSYSSLLYSNWIYIGILGVSCYLVRHRCHASSLFSLLLSSLFLLSLPQSWGLASFSSFLVPLSRRKTVSYLVGVRQSAQSRG